MCATTRPLFLFGALALTGAAYAGPYDPYFTPLGFVSGQSQDTRATAISADGSTVVGKTSQVRSGLAFRWNAASGLASLGDVPGGTGYTESTSVSADGNVVVGQTLSGAFRWTPSGGMVAFGSLPGGELGARAFGVSGDGTTIVGSVSNGGFSEAFRWTSTGLTRLGYLSTSFGTSTSTAIAVSNDGATVMGLSTSDHGQEPFLWTATGGMVPLDSPQGSPTMRIPYGMAADARTIVGEGFVDGHQEAFVWTADGGMIALGDLPGGHQFSRALAVSPDGSVVVGISQVESFQHAFIWDRVNGMRDLHGLLSDRGVVPAGWRITDATAVTITREGVPVVAGYARDPSGKTQAFVAAVPEPATLLALGLGGIALLRRRRG